MECNPKFSTNRSPGTKSEIRNPKAEDRKKAEDRSPKSPRVAPLQERIEPTYHSLRASVPGRVASQVQRLDFLGFRLSAFFRPSGFGFRTWSPVSGWSKIWGCIPWPTTAILMPVGK